MTIPERTRRAERLAKPFLSVHATLLSGLLAAGLSFPMPQAALAGAEPVEQVASALERKWAALCENVPVATFAFGAEIEGRFTIDASDVRWLVGWGKTDFFDVAFTTADGAPAPFATPGESDSGLVTVRLAQPGHPDIGEEKDGWVCVRQGAFTNFVPRSITPVTLDDGRPGRVMAFDYDASWSEPMLQRYDDMTPERSVAALLSFNPGKGWGSLEGEFPAERGKPFPPAMFARKGLAHVDLAAPHPQRIEIDGRGGAELGYGLLYRYPETLPDEVRRCAVQDAPAVAACLKNAAEGGAILGRLSLCEREDIACMRDLLFAPPFRTEPAACLTPDSAGRVSRPDCIFRLAYGLGEDTILDNPGDFLRSRSDGGEIAVHLAASSTAYSEERNQDGLLDRDETNRPWLSLACRDGAIGASLTWTGMPAPWKTHESVATRVHVSGKDTSTYTLRPDADGRVLSVAADDTRSFLRDVFAGRTENTGEVNGVEKPITYHSFDLTAQGDTPLVSDFSFTSRSAAGQGEPIPLWDGMDAACGLTLRAALGD